jgi:rubrerythrin
MTILFSVREIAEAAVEKEKRRRAFFAKVCELSTDATMKDLFQFLTDEEDKHVAVFTQLRDSLPQENRTEEYDEEMDAYMDSVIDDRLYSKVDSAEFVEKAISSKNVFQLAIGFEKDAILYFREFLPFLTEADREIVVGLIEEEKGHIRRLAKVQKQMDESVS